MKSTSYTFRTVLLAALLLFVAACDTVESEPEPVAPEALPEAAFSMDLSLFNGGPNKTSAQGTNFLAAAIRVLVVNTGIYGVLYVPAQVTHAAQLVDPVWNGEAFVWAADTLVNGQSDGFELTARPDGNAITWEMRVSGYDEHNNLRFDDFLLYEARTGLSSNEGTLAIIYPTQEGPIRVLDASYTIVDEADDNTVRFSIPVEVPEVGGMKATYRQEGAWFTLDVTEPDPAKRHIMRWNSETNEGSIQAYDFNNGEEACWDASLQNVACPVGV
ncbi:MAG: hypothetical protein R2834_13160 [Rhodothermales bacterium]